MTKTFRRAFDQLLLVDRARVEQILEEAEDSFLSGEALVPDQREVRDEYDGGPPPTKILRGNPANHDELAAHLDDVDRRWRLDAILALQDYID